MTSVTNPAKGDELLITTLTKFMKLEPHLNVDVTHKFVNEELLKAVPDSVLSEFSLKRPRK